eukprot:102179-Amphidinium_carterae.1
MELVKRTMARALAHAMGQCAPKLAATAQPHFDTIVALESAAGILASYTPSLFSIADVGNSMGKGVLAYMHEAYLMKPQ